MSLWRYRPSERFQGKSGSLRFRRRGEGPPLLLIHGLSGSQHWWKHNLPTLSHQYTVYTVDLSGFGAARQQRVLAMEVYTALLGEFLTAQGMGEIAVMGHSLGGQLALRLAAHQPQIIRQLILACASGLVRGHPAQLALKLPHALLVGNLGFVPQILGDSARAGLPHLWRAASQLLKDDVQELLPQIQARTLVVWGGKDVLIPPAVGRSLAQAIPGARYHEFPKAGHVVMVDAAREFNDLVLGFLGERR